MSVRKGILTDQPALNMLGDFTTRLCEMDQVSNSSRQMNCDYGMVAKGSYPYSANLFNRYV